MKWSSTILALSGALVSAVPIEVEPGIIADTVEKNGINYNVHEDKNLGVRMEFVTNSGVCETTKGVDQHSGYLSVGPMENMFFWFFEARNNPESAPFSTWFNGGPGCSSLIGLFQENGPCQFYNNDTEPSSNPYSWNEYANMLYIDQPISVGFSYGVNTVTSTVTAAPNVWDLLQAFFKRFPKYKSRDFGIFTESYGGHYGPEFASYIQDQNKKIASGALKAQKINLVALGINNGYFDSAIQQPAYIDYSLHNPYRRLITQKQAKQYRAAYKNECAPALSLCTTTDSPLENVQCAAAERICFTQIEGDIANSGNFDVYDVRQPAKDPFPPMTFVKYLNRADIQKKIGAQPTDYQFCTETATVQFLTTGDNSRSFLPTLSEVTQSGIQVLIWHGDADWICNYKGGYRVVQKVEFPGAQQFRTKKMTPYTYKGKSYGKFKSVNNLSWLRVYEAGHEVPYYQPEISLQAFKQTMQSKALTPS